MRTKSNVAFFLIFPFAFVPKMSLISVTSFSFFTMGMFLFFSGFIAAVAMLIPGLSGSLLLLLLGAYEYILQAVVSFSVLPLFLFSLGVLCGFVSMSRLLHVCLKRYHVKSYYAILGLLGGSVFSLWPVVSFDSVRFLVGCLFFIFSFSLVMLFSKRSSQKST